MKRIQSSQCVGLLSAESECVSYVLLFHFIFFALSIEEAQAIHIVLASRESHPKMCYLLFDIRLMKIYYLFLSCVHRLCARVANKWNALSATTTMHACNNEHKAIVIEHTTHAFISIYSRRRRRRRRRKQTIAHLYQR